jgi:16S rRNA (adenine1518-N6/adenine1519-N6)-dimethyltransferase
MLESYGLSPSRKLGQNFLIDGNLMGKLVASAQPAPSDTVLEVGAGTGSLTEMLLERAGHVVAVECDRGLYRLLNDRLGGRRSLTLLHADVLAGKSRMAPSVMEALRQAHRSQSGRLCLVANLPYNIASPLLADMLLCGLPFALACVTVQKEVGDRILASPGGRLIGPLSVVVQSGAAVESVGRVPPQAFWPQPKVDSVMLRLLPKPDRAHLPGLARVVHACFLHRRKTLRYNLQAAFGTEALSKVEAVTDIDTSRRPETLSVTEWESVTAVLPPAHSDGTGGS